MKHVYHIFSLLLLYWQGMGTEARAQNVPKTEPYTLVFKLKGNAAAALSKSAGTAALQRVVQRVASQPAVQKFPRSTPPAAGARIGAKGAVDLSLIYELKYSASQPFAQVKKELLNTGLVEYVEPLYLHAPLHLPNDPLSDSVAGAQDYLKKIMAYKAWDISKGDSNVVIGVLDTGVRLSHEDLKNNLKYNYADPIDGLDNDRDGYVDNFQGWDMADGDNNPIADANGHGTFVTGIAAGHAENGIGITGVGFNSKFLPVKIFSSASSGSFRGYEGIVYAADRGCKVINLSWGGAGFASAFEQDVINYAVLNRDVVIVAAAGNTNEELDFYPATYQNVVSVAALDNKDVKGGSHTYSHNIDLSAQGVDVFSTSNAQDNRYGHGTGSSYASPMVAGAAALLRSHFPDLSALQIAERLRVTADDIYALPGNAAYLEKLGKGRLNVYRALAEPNPISLRLLSSSFIGAPGMLPGQEIQLVGTFQNILSPVPGVTVTLTSSSPFLQVLDGSFTAGSLQTLAQANNQRTPFRLKVAENVPPNTQVNIRFGFTSGAYTDYQYIRVTLHPGFLTTDVNNLAVSVMSAGNIGYEGLNYSQGKGVIYRNGAPLLAEGGLLVGYSPDYVSDNIRNEKGRTDGDFYAVTTLVRYPSSPHADFHASNTLEDSLTQTKNKSFRIKQNVLAWADAPNLDFVLLEYVFTNRSPAPISEAYTGLFADWDLVSAGKNVAEWDNALKLGIIRHTTDTSIWTGIQMLSKGAPGFYALLNATDDSTVNMSDGFSSQEKYQALSGGVQKERAGFDDGKDVSFIISSALKTLAPTETDTVAFALLAGESRAQLKAAAAAAIQKYSQFLISRTITAVAPEISAQAIGLFPNPSTGKVTISLPAALRQTTVSFQLVDSKGQTEPLGSFQKKEQIEYDFSRKASGLYYLRIISPSGVMTQKLVLRK